MEEVPVYSRENVIQMFLQDILKIIEKAKFPVGAVLDRLSELRINWAIFDEKSKKNLLHCAAEQGDCESINRLMYYKIYHIDSYTVIAGGMPCYYALNFACENNHFEAVKLLVQYGANVNAGSYVFEPVLFSAIKSGNMELFDYLVQCGANLNVTDRINRSCLFVATRYGRNDLIDKFINLGQGPWIKNKFGLDLLTAACLSSNYETLKKILDKFNCNPYALDGFNCRPIDYLIEEGDREMLALFVSRGINILEPGFLGFSPLSLACRCSNVETASYLLEIGADPNIPNRKDFSYPIEIAVEKKNLDLVGLLLRNGASVQLQKRAGESLIDKAVKADSPEMIELLARYGADISCRSEFSLSSPLHTAAVKASPAVVSKLIEMGAYVDSLDQDKMTPLHKACANERPEIVSILLQKGADINAAGLMGKRPLDLTNNPIIFQMLTQRGATKQSSWSRCFYMCCSCN